jgi:flavin reductase (DIM6/NTAB) family NADH-FMN oxidoreductase RutF
MMKTFDPSEHHFSESHRLLLGGIAPRPIAFVATLCKDGKPNLSPFSFFNAFGANPPVICFSPAFSGKTGAAKDTLLNLLETKECTVSIISYDMIHQASLASAPYERGVDEFIKAGFTKLPSVKVKAPGVAESKFVMEAKLLHHIDFGGLPGGANMMICEVVMMHIAEDILNDEGGIDPRKIDQVARMGGAWYTRAKEGLFALPQPTEKLEGIDRLPEQVRSSSVLTGRDLAKLASVKELPPFTPVSDSTNIANRHNKAKVHLAQNEVELAWRALSDE